MGLSNVIFLCLFCCGTTRAYRVLPGQEEVLDAKLLQSPLYGPLSGVAFHLAMISQSLSRAQRQALNDEALMKLLDSVQIRSNRIRPLLENVFLLLSKNRLTTGDTEMLQTDFEAMQNIFSQMQRQVQEIGALEDNNSSQGPYNSLSLHVREGSQQAAGLHAAGASHTKSIPSLIAHFLTTEFFPGAEKAYKLDRKLDNFENGEARHYSVADELYSDWRNAHSGIQRSGKRILALIAKVKKSIPRLPSSDEEERLAAAAYFMPKGVSDKVKRQNWHIIGHRLDEAENVAATLVHSLQQTRTKQGKIEHFDLPAAIAIVSQIESIIPRLIEVHKNLHNSEDRVRFLCNRAYRDAIEKQAPLERNNTLRRKLNRLKHDLISMIKGVRQEMALLLGISSGRTTNTIALDLMEPLERFAELEREAHERSQPSRFSAELSDLRALLSDLHRDASHLRRFIQVGDNELHSGEEL
ncbi:hypothetical protein TGPRC2_242590 [Toxoplasma gondii TgCatPRC2]|uniref:Transmembrane protein n=4 Tax=Toxoplasma gondii TaxID=5811 RepID=A0A125YP31_TOXGV|nr:hypothetical protein TGME49_242590 [Toxoplasma gondii ME49]EPT30405.1 hypothetical protein TGME49_242590 [Toxoplasma gondii ME49]ESS31536.1 hypothetical protein TGVEG_242590 [Toxoplasma gondii VEG]KYK72201.1 hypothetical protein TGPRC2_242590 [Toxoplasma gondii TgCatPRC2]PIM02641.1 hypothetical protein TGCOUG_242590 [Toxoplasma gondii COUG]|eukprot:XP_018637484.1 hypothetical protein TGME49_242590 [Toxoplasma gondii ME49]